MAGLCLFARLNKCVTTAPLIAEAERISAMDGGRPAEKINVNMASRINTISIERNFAAREPRIRADQAEMSAWLDWFAAGQKLLTGSPSISI